MGEEIEKVIEHNWDEMRVPDGVDVGQIAADTVKTHYERQAEQVKSEKHQYRMDNWPLYRAAHQAKDYLVQILKK